MSKPAVEGPAAWDALPDGIKAVWKPEAAGMTTDSVLKVQDQCYTAKGNVYTQKWVAWTATHRYTWMLVQSRQQWSVRKTQL